MMWRVQENETSEEKWKSEQASEESDVAKLNWWEINDVESYTDASRSEIVNKFQTRKSVPHGGNRTT